MKFVSGLKSISRPRNGGAPLCIAGLAVLLLSFVPAAGRAERQAGISIAAGVTGGVFYVIGGAMAQVISKYVPGVEATAEVTAGSVDNCKLLGVGKVELALVMADNALDAYSGIDHFKKTGKIPLRALAVLWPPISHVVTLEGRKIHSLSDLKGKRVSTGPPGSGSESIALRILEALDLDPAKDIRRERLSLSESVNALKDYKIDAFFWIGGLPTGGILDLAASPGMQIKLLPHDDLLDKINRRYGPRYQRMVIPRGTYPGMAQDVPVIATGNLLVCRQEMSEPLAYQVVKAVLEHRDELKRAHREAAKITLEGAASPAPVPFHPGAILYYKEKKVWKGP